MQFTAAPQTSESSHAAPALGERHLSGSTIPVELRKQERWMVWRQEHRDGKLTKPPYSARTGRSGSSTDPSTWSTFEEAWAALEHGYDGIGIALTANDDLVGIDLDHCVDKETGAVDAWALDLVDRFDSYTEVSPSGSGLRIFVYGSLPGSGRKKHLNVMDAHKDAAVEVYSNGRYLTVTGWHLEWTPASVKRRQDALRAIHDELWPVVESQPTSTVVALPIDVDEAELLRRAFANEKNGGRIRALYDGDRSDHGGDHSAADLAFLNHLAFWLGKDAAAMERVFSQSVLGQRDKWRNRPDYRQSTIERAIAGCTSTYSGGVRGVQLADVQTWPEHVAEPGPANGHCSAHCDRHLVEIAELRKQLEQDRARNVRRAELFRQPKEVLNPSEKLLIDSLLNEQASRESLGKTDKWRVLVASEQDPEHPEREGWTDSSLTGRLGVSRSTADRALNRVTGPGGLWVKVPEESTGTDGLKRTRLCLEPREGLSADKLWREAVKFQPPVDEDGNPKPRTARVQCKHHPQALIEKTTTWKCSVCHREAKPPKVETIDPFADLPDIQNDDLVTGDAEPGPAPGRDPGTALLDTQQGEASDGQDVPTCRDCGKKLFPDEDGVCEECAPPEGDTTAQCVSCGKALTGAERKASRGVELPMCSSFPLCIRGAGND